MHRHAGRSCFFVGIAASLLLADAPARACGCFAPPDPTVSILQAGERIVFAVFNNQVTAHIQIQYSGDAKDFGWLLPLSSVPTLELGTDELFTALTQRTDPTYAAVYRDRNQCPVSPSDANFAVAGDLNAPSPGDLGSAGSPDPLVVKDSLGPYDYAVLRADDQTAMFKWLTTNHYFIPTGTDAAVAPYIHPGGYFLALKLKPNQSSGSLQPIVVHYASDLPMIPLTLTSVGAERDMGIWVWLLGDSRAIPRNYYHVVINDAQMNWPAQGFNYQSVVSQAVGEAPGKHAFVTEFAAPSAIMKNVLDAPNRFGSAPALARITDAALYTQYLRDHGYPFTTALLSILQKYIAMPPELVQQGVTPGQYYYNISFYQQTRPQAFQGVNLKFNSAQLTADLQSRIVAPTLAAGALFSAHPYMTRLHTNLSPEDMTRDPVFSFNPFLADVDPNHVATVDTTYDCGAGRGAIAEAVINTPEGFTIHFPGGNFNRLPQMPSALRIEALRENGLPEVVTDNRPIIQAALAHLGPPEPVDAGISASPAPDLGVLTTPPQDAGCNVAPGAAGHAGLLGLALLALVALLLAGRNRGRC